MKILTLIISCSKKISLDTVPVTSIALEEFVITINAIPSNDSPNIITAILPRSNFFRPKRSTPNNPDRISMFIQLLLYAFSLCPYKIIGSKEL